MSATTENPAPEKPATGNPRRPLSAVLLSIVVVVVGAGAANALLAAIGLAAGLGGPSAIGLVPIAYLSLTVVAAVGGAVGWWLIARSARRPSRVMRRLVPTVLVVSFVPDVLVGAMAGNAEGWAYAAVLMAMHVATVAVAILTFRRLMPLPDRTPVAVAD